MNFSEVLQGTMSKTSATEHLQTVELMSNMVQEVEDVTQCTIFIFFTIITVSSVFPEAKNTRSMFFPSQTAG